MVQSAPCPGLCLGLPVGPGHEGLDANMPMPQLPAVLCKTVFCLWAKRVMFSAGTCETKVADMEGRQDLAPSRVLEENVSTPKFDLAFQVWILDHY